MNFVKKTWSLFYLYLKPGKRGANELLVMEWLLSREVELAEKV